MKPMVRCVNTVSLGEWKMLSTIIIAADMIDDWLDDRVGERCMENKKISTHTQDLSMEMHSYGRGRASTYPYRSLSGSVY